MSKSLGIVAGDRTEISAEERTKFLKECTPVYDEVDKDDLKFVEYVEKSLGVKTVLRSFGPTHRDILVS